MESYFKKSSERIKEGADYTLYMIYCNGCNVYKRILSSAPAGPGGTLSCPICRHRKENGPHIEGAYGFVKSKSFRIKLPKGVDIIKP